MVYHPKTIRALGIAQIVIGGILIALGIGVFFVRTDYDALYAKYVGYGIWIGCWVLATGLLGFFGSRHPQIPSKCLLGTFMGFAITSCVMSGIMLISYAVALSYVSHRGYYYNYSSNYSYDYNRYEGATAMFSIFVLMSISEFFISLASSIYCCNAVCSINGVMATQQVVYLQPGAGQMQGGMMVVTSGTTGGTIMQPVQGQGQYMVQQPAQPGYWAVPQPGATTAYSPAYQSQAAGFAVASGTTQQQTAQQQQILKGSDALPAYRPTQ